MKKHQNRKKNRSYLIYMITGIAVLLIAAAILAVVFKAPAPKTEESDVTLQTGVVSPDTQNQGNPSAPGSSGNTPVSSDPADMPVPSSDGNAEAYVPEGEEVPVEMPSGSDPVTTVPPAEAGGTSADGSSSGNGQNTSTGSDQGSQVSPAYDDGAIWLPEVP